jgi:hypothetical protein
MYCGGHKTSPSHIYSQYTEPKECCAKTEKAIVLQCPSHTREKLAFKATIEFARNEERGEWMRRTDQNMNPYCSGDCDDRTQYETQTTLVAKLQCERLERQHTEDEFDDKVCDGDAYRVQLPEPHPVLSVSVICTKKHGQNWIEV